MDFGQMKSVTHLPLWHEGEQDFLDWAKNSSSLQIPSYLNENAISSYFNEIDDTLFPDLELSDVLPQNEPFSDNENINHLYNTENFTCSYDFLKENRILTSANEALPSELVKESEQDVSSLTILTDHDLINDYFNNEISNLQSTDLLQENGLIEYINNETLSGINKINLYDEQYESLCSPTDCADEIIISIDESGDYNKEDFTGELETTLPNSPVFIGSPKMYSPVVDHIYVDESYMTDDSLSSLLVVQSTSKPYAKYADVKCRKLKSRKERKKEQNKAASFRYRQKKRDEHGSLLDQLKLEEEKHDKLTEKYKKLKMEKSFMQKLLKDIFLKK